MYGICSTYRKVLCGINRSYSGSTYVQYFKNVFFLRGFRFGFSKIFEKDDNIHDSNSIVRESTPKLYLTFRKKSLISDDLGRRYHFANSKIGEDIIYI